MWQFCIKTDNFGVLLIDTLLLGKPAEKSRELTAENKRPEEADFYDVFHPPRMHVDCLVPNVIRFRATETSPPYIFLLVSRVKYGSFFSLYPIK